MLTRRLLVACLTLVLALAAGSTALAGTSAKGKLVGTVTAISGTRDVKIRATPTSTAVNVRIGTRIRLGATIIMGRGAKATLRLRRPATVPRTRDLVYVRSARGTKHTSTLTRDARGILVRIAPS